MKITNITIDDRTGFFDNIDNTKIVNVFK